MVCLPHLLVTSYNTAVMPSEPVQDWDNLRFNRRAASSRPPNDTADTRFVIGIVVFLVTALLYP